MDVPELVGPRVRLTPRTPEHVEALVELVQAEGIARWWNSDDEAAARYAVEPFGDPEYGHWAVLEGDTVVGLLDVHEEPEPMYRHASLDIALDPERHRQGLGFEILTLAVNWLLDERGHHRITIDPAADNVAAIGCYAKVGFEPVGVMRMSERDRDGKGWHDSLLMELIRKPS